MAFHTADWFIQTVEGGEGQGFRTVLIAGGAVIEGEAISYALFTELLVRGRLELMGTNVPPELADTFLEAEAVNRLRAQEGHEFEQLHLRGVTVRAGGETFQFPVLAVRADSIAAILPYASA